MNLAHKKILGKFTKVLGFGKTSPPHVGKNSQIISFFFFESVPYIKFSLKIFTTWCSNERGGGSKAFWTMLKKTALFLHDGFPKYLSSQFLNISTICVPFPSRMPFSLTGQMFLKIVSFFSTPFYTPLFWLKNFLLLSFNFSCTYNLLLTLILFLPFSIPQNRKPKFLHQIQSIMYSFHNTVYTSPDIR